MAAPADGCKNLERIFLKKASCGRSVSTLTIAVRIAGLMAVTASISTKWFAWMAASNWFPRRVSVSGWARTS